MIFGSARKVRKGHTVQSQHDDQNGNLKINGQSLNNLDNTNPPYSPKLDLSAVSLTSRSRLSFGGTGDLGDLPKIHNEAKLEKQRSSKLQLDQKTQKYRLNILGNGSDNEDTLSTDYNHQPRASYSKIEIDNLKNTTPTIKIPTENIAPDNTYLASNSEYTLIPSDSAIKDAKDQRYRSMLQNANPENYNEDIIFLDSKIEVDSNCSPSLIQSYHNSEMDQHRSQATNLVIREDGLEGVRDYVEEEQLVFDQTSAALKRQQAKAELKDIIDVAEESRQLVLDSSEDEWERRQLNAFKKIDLSTVNKVHSSSRYSNTDTGSCPQLPTFAQVIQNYQDRLDSLKMEQAAVAKQKEALANELTAIVEAELKIKNEMHDSNEAFDRLQKELQSKQMDVITSHETDVL